MLRKVLDNFYSQSQTLLKMTIRSRPDHYSKSSLRRKKIYLKKFLKEIEFKIKFEDFLDMTER